MLLSKSFGYAIRGILYISMMQKEGRKVQVEEIAEKLAVPKHFLGKILQELVKVGLLKSTKGPYGGFELASETLSKSLFDIFKTTDDAEQLTHCVLRTNPCDPVNPCPVHQNISKIREEFRQLLLNTTVGDLAQGETELTLERIATNRL